MAAIIVSLWKLADKMGLGVHKGTIEEQVNAMNKALEQPQENNIADALWNYADASGGPATLIEKSITTNGEYNAADDTADGYKKVIANVANTYTNEDEGKVVNSGALIAQTAYPSEITENDTYDTTNYNSITVNVSGGVSSDDDVLFYDYDGTLLYSYTKEDFLALTAMPDNPTHEGLTAQGWNWTLTDAQAYVTNYGKHIIGQTYTTSDGRTRLYINLDSTHLSPKLSISLMDNTEVDIDWGDGSEHTTIVSGTYSATHTYASAGDYVISFAVITGKVYIDKTILSDSNNSANSYYACSIHKVEMGAGVNYLSGGFKSCKALRTITLPNTITSLYSSDFNECWALIALIIPNNITNLGYKVCQNCYSLSVVSMSDSIMYIDGNAFYGCYGLSTLIFPSKIPSIGTSCCYNAYSLSTVVIPNGVNSIGAAAFNNCYNLQSITIGDSVTSIGGTAMINCYSLQTVNIPNSVTSIGGGAFADIKFLTINIDNTEDAISGAPWDADSHSVVNWLRSE